jgi:uncharacterized membrane protein (DUF485 family)
MKYEEFDREMERLRWSIAILLLALLLAKIVLFALAMHSRWIGMHAAGLRDRITLFSNLADNIHVFNAQQTNLL